MGWENQPFWVTLVVPPGSAAGDYSATLAVPVGGDRAEVPVPGPPGSTTREASSPTATRGPSSTATARTTTRPWGFLRIEPVD